MDTILRSFGILWDPVIYPVLTWSLLAPMHRWVVSAQFSLPGDARLWYPESPMTGMAKVVEIIKQSPKIIKKHHTSLKKHKKSSTNHQNHQQITKNHQNIHQNQKNPQTSPDSENVRFSPEQLAANALGSHAHRFSTDQIAANALEVLSLGHHWAIMLL